MAAPTDAENKRINAQTVTPSRSAAVASTTGKLPSVVERLTVASEFPSIGVIINHTRTDYVLAAVPTTWANVIPDPKVGDRAFVFLVDNAQSTTAPYDYQEFHYTLNAATPAVLAWRKVTYA